LRSLREFDLATAFDRALTASTSTGAEVIPEHVLPLAPHLPGSRCPPSDEDMTTPRADLESLSAGTAFPYIEHYLPYVYPNPVSLLDYAPPDALIVVEDWDDLSDTVAEIEAKAVQAREDSIAKRQLAPDHRTPYVDWEALTTALEGRKILQLGYEAEVGEGLRPSPTDDGRRMPRLFTPGGRFGGQLRPLLNQLRQVSSDGERVVVVSQQAARLTELWYEQEGFMPVVSDILETPAREAVLFVTGALHEGWTLRADEGDVHLLTDAEIFGWSRPEPRRRKAATRKRAPEESYADWSEGDFVVHVDYGIGRFAGMRHRTVEGLEREYLLVEYAGTDMLFVPIHQADRLTRYVGPDEKPPALNKLGQPSDWLRIRRRAERAVEEEARELLALYSARSDARPCLRLDALRHELETSFPMSRPKILKAVRGQGGHGAVIADGQVDLRRSWATEDRGALRAASNGAGRGNRSRAVLTTVLRQQHYRRSPGLAAFRSK
jgi:transcription-repair coupling factor (superfamily II helicase)